MTKDKKPESLATMRDWPWSLLDAIASVDEKYALSPDQLPSDFDGSVEYVIRTLQEREEYVILQRYKEKRTYSEIGADLEVSGNRVYQLANKALRKLRHPIRFCYLQDGVYQVKKRAMQKAAEEACERAVNEYLQFREFLAEHENAAKYVYPDTPPSVPIMDSIDKLDISMHAFTCLYHHGFKTVLDVLELSREKFYAIPRLGAKTAENIIAGLTAAGYKCDHLKNE